MSRTILFASILALCPIPVLAGDGAQTEWQALVDKIGSSKGTRSELVAFCQKWPGTMQAVKAAGYLREKPSPLDQFDPKSIPELERFTWHPKETVAILGEHRGRQAGAVTGVAWGKGGKWLGSSSTNGLVRIWDPTTMRLQHTFGHGQGAYCLAFGADNAFVIHGGGDGHVHIQDMTATPPKLKETCKVASTPVLSIALGPQSKWFVAGGSDTQLNFWDLTVTPAVQLQAANGHTGAIHAVAVCPDGKTVASAGADKTIRLWQFGERIKERGGITQAHTGVVHGLAWHPSDDNTLASVGDDGFIRVWNHVDGKLTLRGQVKGAEAAGYSIAFSPSGRSLATAWSDNKVRIHGLVGKTLTFKSLLEGHLMPVKSVAFAPDATSLATGSDDWSVRLWPPTGPRPLDRTMKTGHVSHVYSVAFSPDEKGLATASYDMSVRFWDFAGGSIKERTSTIKREGAIYTVAYAPDGKSVAAAGVAMKVYLFDPTTGRPLKMLKGHTSHIGNLAFSTRGALASSSLDHTVRIWDPKAGKETHVLDDFKNYIHAVSFSPDGLYLGCCSGTYLYDDKGRIVYRNNLPVFADSTVRLYDTTIYKEAYRYTNDQALPGSVGFTADSKHFLAGASDGMLRRWDVSGPKDPEVILKGNGGISQLTRSPDGRFMAAYGPNYQVQVFDAATGKTLKRWSLSEQFGSVAFALDSRHLAISLGTGVTLILRLEEAKK